MPDRVEDPRDELRVVRSARDQVAGADPVVIAGVELERAPEDAVADVRIGLRAVPDREVVAEGAADRLDGPERGHASARPPERASVAVHDPGVDRIANQERCGERGALPGEPGDDRADNCPAQSP